VTSSTPPPAPDLGATTPRWPGFDRLGITQAIGGLVLWRRDPDDERRMSAIEIEIARIKSDSEQIEKETEQL
jgi:hypothetical protein